MEYRKDIDGLRALAILTVVLYHAGFSFAAGGYVGVDVFFVISGFLITSIIYRDISNSKFKFIDFYERRIRRLFPAIIATLIPTCIVSYFILLPSDYTSFTDSLISNLFFVTNFYFYSVSGYFDTTAFSKPLLHTWSLSIEEQFYFFFPATLILINNRFSKYKIILLSLLFVFSLIFSVVITQKNSSAGFFLPHSRAWELLLGALIALTSQKFNVKKITSEIISSAALVTILICASLYNDNTKFPGIAAVPPCVATAILIYTGNSCTLAKSLLSHFTLNALGKISYSLYLIHWPIFSLYKYHVVRELFLEEKLILILISLILATLSWKNIETPIRNRRYLKNRNHLIFTCAILLSATSCLPALTAAARNHSLLIRHPIVESFDDVNPRRKECHGISPEKILKDELCQIGNSTSPVPDYISWGDSHMDALMPLLEKISRDNNLYGWHATYSACPPLINADFINAPRNFKCKNFNNAMLSVIKKNKIKNVILSARWIRDLNNLRVEKSQLTRYISWEGSKQGDSKYAIKSSLEYTLSELTSLGTNVWIVDQIPEFNTNVPNLLFQKIVLNNNINAVSIPYSDYLSETRDLKEILYDITKKYSSIKIIKPADKICEDNSTCIAATNDFSLYRDEHHLTIQGSLFLEPLFNNFATQILKDKFTAKEN